MATLSPAAIPAPKAPPNKWLITVAITVGTMMGAVDASIVNVAIPNIQATFGVPITTVTWIATAYLIALALVMPLTAWLSATFGRKLVYQVSLLLFVGASIVAGLAPTLGVLVVARVLQGFGGGVLGPIEQAILRETFPPREQGLAMGLYAVVVVLGPTVGPLLGGWFVTNYDWHWIFFINVPIGLIGSLMVAAFVIEPSYIKARRMSFDGVGIAFMSVGLTTLLVVLEQGNRWDWFHSTLVWALLALSTVTLLAFVLWELYGTPTPAVNLRVLSNRALAGGSLGAFILGFSLFGAIFLQSLFLQELLGYTALQAGVSFLPRGTVTMLISPLAGILYYVVGARTMVLTGSLLTTLGLFLMSRWTLAIGIDQMLIPLALLGFALPFLFVSITTASLSGIDRRRLTEATGLINLVRQLGSSFGTAFTATLLERGITTAGARLVTHATLANGWFATLLQEITALVVQRGPSDLWTAQHRALATLSGLITQQATLLSFERTFEVLALLSLTMILVVPALPRRPAGQAPRTLSH
jgi:MFS transporter, DHA2 family, multidrug resistance protein